MTDTLDADGNPITPPGEESPNMKRMRELAEKGQQAEEALARAATLERENALLRSGVDTETPLGKLFAKAYDGENDPEAIKAAATEAGIPLVGTTTPPAEGAQTPPPEEPTGTEQRQQLAAGAPADTGEMPHPNTIARQIFDKEMESGGTWEEAAGLMIASKSAAAMSGDLRGTVRQGPVDQ